MINGKWYRVFYEDDIGQKYNKVLIFAYQDKDSKVFVNPLNNLEEGYPDEWLSKGRYVQMSEKEIKEWEQGKWKK